MKKRSALVTALALMLIISLTACNNEKPVSTEKDLTPVQVSVIEKKAIKDTETYTGRIEPAKQVNVASKSFGEVKEVFFDIGDRVKEGDVLFTMDKKSLSNNIQGLENQIKTQVNQSQSSVDTTKLQYEDAKRNYEKMVALYEQGAVSKSDFEKTEVAFNQAKIAYETAKKNHSLVLGHDSSKNSLEAQLQNTVDSMLDLDVKSPINGIVASKNIEFGELANTSAPSFTVVDIDTVFLDIKVPEKYINNISLKQEVNVLVEAIGNKEVKGIVSNISPVADNQTFTYTVRIEIPNKDGVIKGGMFASASFPLEARDSAVVVQRKALKLEGNQWFAYIVEGDIIKKVNVTVGIDNGTEMEIIKGLEAGQKIVTKGTEYIKDGEQVKVVDNQ